MPAWAWIPIGVVVLALIAIGAWLLASERRSARLRHQFGPEYDRTVDRADDRRAAERELAERRSRREQLDIRPLNPAIRDEYAQQWQGVQAEFVDSPESAVREADVLVMRVMRDRGYPMEDFERRAADISVEHPVVVECYRAAHRVSRLNERGEATTEDLRLAVQNYRALFDELLDGSADEATSRERGADDTVRDTSPAGERTVR